MSKFYYSDPLAAAWMCHAFSMTFENWDGDLIVNADDMTDEVALRAACDGVFRPCRYTLSAESVCVLQPRPGDIVTSAEVSPALVVDNASRYPSRVDAKQAQEAALDPRNDVRIIQRDGKPFFWPEVEA